VLNSQREVHAFVVRIFKMSFHKKASNDSPLRSSPSFCAWMPATRSQTTRHESVPQASTGARH